MNKAGWIVALILFIACVHLYTKQQGSKAPVTQGVTVQIDTVRVHDTTRTIIHGSDFTVHRVAVIKTAVDTSKIDSSAVPPKDNTAADSAVCYNFSQTYASGAYVQAEMCSRFFPQNRPGDLAGNIIYRPGNDTMKLFSRVDTIPKVVFKPPTIPTWQAVILGVAAGVIGVWMVKR
jgi:hypothetical protein